MIGLLSRKYYYILAAVAVYFVFNLTVRDNLIDRFVNPSSVNPITDNALAYARETKVRDIFVYSSLVSLLAILVISLALLFSKQNKTANKVVVFAVSLLITVFFLLWASVGGFSWIA